MYSYIYFPELASLQTLKFHHVTLTTFDPVYIFLTAILVHIYFLELASLQTLKFYHVTLTTFDPVYAFPTAVFIHSWTGKPFKHWNFIMSHLQHFTQCIRIPHSSTHTYILSWNGKPTNTETSSCYTYNILPSVRIPHSSTCTCTFLNWQAFKHLNFIMPHLQHFAQCMYPVYAFPTAVLIHKHSRTGKPSNTETSLCHTDNILPSVYMHTPHHCSMASLQNYEHFHTLWINLQNITNSFKTYTLECVIHLTFLK